MEILLQIVLALGEFLFEILLQILMEALFSIGLHAAREPFRLPRPNPWMAALGYAIYGTVAGGVSLLVFPTHFIMSPVGRIANLAVSPLVAGGAMVFFGRWRRERGKELLRIDHFAYGFLFAFAMALVRYFFTQPNLDALSAA